MYAVTINNSTAAVVSGAGQYVAGANVVINATSVPAGKVVQFSGVPGQSGAVNGSSVRFTMPANAVTITVALVDAAAQKYNVSAETPSEYTGLGEYSAGAQVTVRDTGSVSNFSWLITKVGGGIVNASTSGKTATFTMPAANVEVLAAPENE